jgi:glucosyl-3-phosphoglycerate synthase
VTGSQPASQPASQTTSHVALLVPALNEESAMARTAGVMAEAVRAGLVDRAVVLDGGSTDATASIAHDRGVEVLDVSGTFSHLGPVLGKGDSLFRGIHTVRADHYVFLDADLGNVSVHHVAALATRITRGDAVFVKAGFVRVDEHGTPRAIPAGRVTEEVARPLLATVSPTLAALSQPLSGQVAIRGTVARDLSIVTGYGVEIAMAIDIHRAHGTGAIAEVDLGPINNRWKPDAALDDVRAQVIAGAALRGVGVAPNTDHSHRLVVDRYP